jgi:hypothetical protein
MNIHQKYLKYKNKYMKLKKQIGGLETLHEGLYREPIFSNHNIFKNNEVLKNKIINDIIIHYNSEYENIYLPVFLISTLFFSYNDYVEKSGNFVYNRFVRKIQGYENIYIIDYENLINVTYDSIQDIEVHRTNILYNLIQKCEDVNALFILCCKYHSNTTKPNIEILLNNLDIPRPDNLITISIHQKNNFASHATAEFPYNGADDDFIFWLLTLSLFNIKNEVSNMNNIYLITNDIQRTCDKQQKLKNLYTELVNEQAGNFRYAVVNDHNIQSFVDLLNMLRNYMIINIPNMENLKKHNILVDDMRSKKSSHSDDDNQVIINDVEYDTYTLYLNKCFSNGGKFLNGTDIAMTCNDMSNYNGIEFNIFKQRVQNNCSNLFIQLISYIKYIQNITYQYCHYTDHRICSLSQEEIRQFIIDPSLQSMYDPSLQSMYYPSQSMYDPSLQSMYYPSQSIYNPSQPPFKPTNYK